ncbi:MAG: AsmA family protein [Herminiimonas sp.]|nr:AsmA family protein [Herminiimonas sp.]
MKTFGKIMAVLLAIVAVVIIALVIFIKSFDWDRARPFINEKVSAATGRTFEIAGHLSAKWARPPGASGLRGLIPWPTFTAANVRIDNPAWAKRPQFATVDALEVEVEILPLLARKIIIPRIALSNPVVDLERTLDQKNTWTFTRKQDEKSKWDLQLQELQFAEGVVTVTDLPTGVDLRADIQTLGKPLLLGNLLEKQKTLAAEAAAKANTPGTDQAGAKNPTAPTAPNAPDDTDDRYGFAVKLAGTYRDAKLDGTGKIGGALSLIDRERPFPLQADVHLGDNHLTLLGTLTDPAKLAAVDLRLTLAAASMADLYDLIGVALPETPKFRTSGHLTGNFAPEGKHFKYEQFTGQVGKSDLSGTLEFASGGPRPRLTGNVASKRLALVDLGPVIGAKVSSKAAPKAAPGAAKVPPAANARALPSTAFKTDRWRAMDADVTFKGASIIRDAALPITDMSTHIIMQDGVLSFDPLKFGVAGGTMTGTIRLDGRSQPLDGKIDIAARHLQLKKLMPAFQPMDTSFGEINGDARLTGRGNSSAALAATANGEVKLLVNDGAISNALLEEAGLNVANIVAAKLFGDKVVRINCAAADFVVKNGVLDSHIFALDTTDALINVDGTINLATEQMMLNVYPHTKGFRVFSLRSPLYVRGTFKNPDVGVVKGPLIMRGAAALALGAINPLASLMALLAPSNKQTSPCPTIMATAREGLKGTPAIQR